MVAHYRVSHQSSMVDIYRHRAKVKDTEITIGIVNKKCWNCGGSVLANLRDQKIVPVCLSCGREQ